MGGRSVPLDLKKLRGKIGKIRQGFYQIFLIFYSNFFVVLKIYLNIVIFLLFSVKFWQKIRKLDDLLNF